MFDPRERFTPAARRSVAIAQEMARRFRRPIVGPVHLVLGVFGADEPAMASLLAQLGADRNEIIERISAIPEMASVDMDGPIPFHDDTKKVLTATLRVALALGDDHMATTHILLAFLQLDRGRV